MLNTQSNKLLSLCVLVYAAFFFTAISCSEKIEREKLQEARADIRFGNRFYSIYINKTGDSYAVKGSGSYYTDSLEITFSDTSEIFKVDSAKLLFERLEGLRVNPVVGSNRLGAPRVEIYYNRLKVYDAYRWDEVFWSIFTPIMEQIPQGFNPFRANDHPFD